jgi:hypothetical protein
VAGQGGKVMLTLVSVAILTLTWYGWQFIRAPTEAVTTTNVSKVSPPPTSAATTACT